MAARKGEYTWSALPEWLRHDLRDVAALRAAEPTLYEQDEAARRHGGIPLGESPAYQRHLRDVMAESEQKRGRT